LRLGYGFLPVKSESDYLSNLTDLTVLETLGLVNDNIGVGTIVIDAPIDVELFSSASNVTSLTVEWLNPDAVELIDLLRLSGQLFSLSLRRFCDTQPPEHHDEGLGDMPHWDPPRSFSQPLEQAGRHWQRLLVGDISWTSKLPQGILDCLETYEQIEDLTIPLPTQMWPQFRDRTIPFFQKNLQSIAQGDERALLTHLGVGGDVHTCMLLPTGASYGLAPFNIEMAGQIWSYHVVKFTSDEAAVFDTVREWYEGMLRLRVGGDDGIDW
jgi:hypothetical protein